MELLRQVQAMNAEAQRQAEAIAERRHLENLKETRYANRTARFSLAVSVFSLIVSVICAIIAARSQSLI